MARWGPQDHENVMKALVYFSEVFNRVVTRAGDRPPPLSTFCNFVSTHDSLDVVGHRRIIVEKVEWNSCTLKSKIMRDWGKGWCFDTAAWQLNREDKERLGLETASFHLHHKLPLAFLCTDSSQPTANLLAPQRLSGSGKSAPSLQGGKSAKSEVCASGGPDSWGDMVCLQVIEASRFLKSFFESVCGPGRRPLWSSCVHSCTAIWEVGTPQDRQPEACVDARLFEAEDHQFVGSS